MPSTQLHKIWFIESFTFQHLQTSIHFMFTSINTSEKLYAKLFLLHVFKQKKARDPDWQDDRQDCSGLYWMLHLYVEEEKRNWTSILVHILVYFSEPGVSELWFFSTEICCLLTAVFLPTSYPSVYESLSFLSLYSSNIILLFPFFVFQPWSSLSLSISIPSCTRNSFIKADSGCWYLVIPAAPPAYFIWCRFIKPDRLNAEIVLNI